MPPKKTAKKLSNKEESLRKKSKENSSERKHEVFIEQEEKKEILSEIKQTDSSIKIADVEQVEDQSKPSLDELYPVNRLITTEYKLIQSFQPSFGPTISDLVNDPIAVIAAEIWMGEKASSCTYSESLVVTIFKKDLLHGDTSRYQILENSQFLENYLWNFYSQSVGFEHQYSTLLLINEKCKIGLHPFAFIANNKEKCDIFFQNLIDMIILNQLDISLKEPYILFFINAFQYLENPVIRENVLSLVALSLWDNLNPTRLEIELSKNSQLKNQWQKLITKQETNSNIMEMESKKRKRKKGSTSKDINDVATSQAAPKNTSQWMKILIQDYFSIMLSLCNHQHPSHSDELFNDNLRYVERLIELLIDLLSQLPTRRYLRTYLDDLHFIFRCKKYSFLQISEGKLLNNLISRLDNYLHFDVDDITGKPLTRNEIMEVHNQKCVKFQQIAYVHYFKKLKDLVFVSIGELSKPSYLRKYLEWLEFNDLKFIAENLQLNVEYEDNVTREDIMELILNHLTIRNSILDEFQLLSLFPTEKLLWHVSQLPLQNDYRDQKVLSLPKLNLQFLTEYDYLLRNFNLYRLESAFEIREDIMNAVKRMAPREIVGGKNQKKVAFGGWSRMALPILGINMDQIAKPKIGEIAPAHVDCTITIDLSQYSGEIRSEWESFREHDVVFLIAIQNPKPIPTDSVELNRKQTSDVRFEVDNPMSIEEVDFLSHYGIKYVRGAEVFEFRDEDNVILNDPVRPDDRATGRVGKKRKLRLHLDPAQYYLDIKEGHQDCYELFNLVVRRERKENNFKSILDTICKLMGNKSIGHTIPIWLRDVFLGYGNPSAASFRNLLYQKNNDPTSTSNEIFEQNDYKDTFIDGVHLKESFPDCARIEFESLDSQNLNSIQSDPGNYPSPPYRLQIHWSPENPKQKCGESMKKILVTSYQTNRRTPYPQDVPPTNKIRFTRTQVEAIRSGMNEGLTMIVGPPGTGKTDVAVQIIANLYHNHPTQKILIVTHSNAALNDLFEKIMQRDVAPRHLLRLGSGEQELRDSMGGTDRSRNEIFSKEGRVNWSLLRRMELLNSVQRLCLSLGLVGDHWNSCETAQFFHADHIQPRIQKFHEDYAKMIKNANQTTQNEVVPNISIQIIFPFNQYFFDTPVPIFHGNLEEDYKSAGSCIEHINYLFSELADYRAFEVLRTHSLRNDYLLIKQARIVAMTCTHAALTRNKLIELGFKYDSILMEEAAQMLEIETMIPILLQDVNLMEGCRLKRVILIGDHHQLPPIVKNLAIQKFSKFDQSLFTRFIRLGVTAVQLDQQGRARPEIAQLYAWRYSTENSSMTSGQKSKHGDEEIYQMHSLKNLDLVIHGDEFQHANAGFVETTQLIDVPYFNGKGETSPTPYFYQNLGEAEYVVAVYQYMRLLGYPSSGISILTTYNGQRSLISDIIRQRCRNELFGSPRAISTVDKYQGQQNDIILLSLVRTESVGHIRDIRRLIVALSRARLGLYVFCHLRLFQNCYELAPSLQYLLQKPSKLKLIAGEGYPCQRRCDEIVKDEAVFTIQDATEMGVLVYQMVQQATETDAEPMELVK